MVRQGDQGDAMFIHVAGKLQLQVDGTKSNDDRAIQTGQFFGEVALLSRGKRTASVKVPEGEQAVVLRMNRALLQPLLEKRPDLTISLLDAVVRRAGLNMDMKTSEQPPHQQAPMMLVEQANTTERAKTLDDHGRFGMLRPL